MKVAVLVDGGFFLKRIPRLVQDFQWDAARTANLVVSYCRRHVEHDEDSTGLYRLFYYDCPPLSKKAHQPISKTAVDFSKSSSATFRNAFLEELRKRRKVALRLGDLRDNDGWHLKPSVLKELLQNKRKWENLKDEDFTYAVRQKGVDSRIAVDIVSLALKHQVQRIVLIAGDGDFVPAAKLARREGIDFILDPLHNHIDPALHEHIDGCHSKLSRGRKSEPLEQGVGSESTTVTD